MFKELGTHLRLVESQSEEEKQSKARENGKANPEFMNLRQRQEGKKNLGKN